MSKAARMMMVALAALTALPVAAQKTDPAARVNGQAIPQEALEKTLMDWFGHQVLEEMIQAEVISQAAKKANITATDAEVEQALAALRASMDQDARANGGESFAEFLGRTRHTEASLRSQIRTSMLLERMVKDQAVVTDQEAADFYEKNPARFREPAKVKVGLISLKTEEKAREVRDLVLTGKKTWGDAAREFNVNPVTMQADGSLGFITLGDNPIAKAAFALDRDGAITEVIPYRGLFNLVRREDRCNERMQPFEEARPVIKDALQRERIHRLALQKREDLMRAAHIERLLTFPGTPVPAPAGP